MTRVKICGITNQDDALCAAETGAHALGFVFYSKSPRNIKLRIAAKICQALPPFISKVGVFVNESEATIQKIVRECGLSAIQLHGDESPAFCQKFDLPVIKAFQIRSIKDMAQLSKYQVNGHLLDTYSEKMRGGTGAVFDWNLAVKAKRFGRRIILSGGLTPQNVVQAIRKVQPFAMDVSSGVEKSPGKKDPAKIKSFLRACMKV